MTQCLRQTSSQPSSPNPSQNDSPPKLTGNRRVELPALSTSLPTASRADKFGAVLTRQVHRHVNEPLEGWKTPRVGLVRHDLRCSLLLRSKTLQQLTSTAQSALLRLVQRKSQFCAAVVQPEVVPQRLFDPRRVNQGRRVLQRPFEHDRVPRTVVCCHKVSQRRVHVSEPVLCNQ